LSVLHIIVGLNVGGAEAMLKRLIESNPASTRNAVVVSLTALGVIGESLRAQGVRVHALGMSSSLDAPITLWRLVRLIRRYQPRIVQTWMYHADLLGGVAARLAGSCAVVWGIRCTTLPQGPLSVMFWLVRLCAICSHIVPHRIICCAKSAKEVHIKLGYPEHKMTVIPNGYNFTAFDRHLTSRVKARTDLGINEGEIVIGAVGRFDPQKDFHNFVTAASNLFAKRANVTFLMVGRNIEWANITLRGWIESAKCAKRFHLLGEQPDVPYFLSAMDIFCLSSNSEGFPNVVAEAMAMGVPCVVTRVGDAADIVGVDDFVVPVSDSASLTDALLRMCDLDPGERKRLGEKGASKVRAEYGIENIRQKYEEIYAEIAGN
jgi:glycosyltransferase involved in cell wall biosynthesis